MLLSSSHRPLLPPAPRAPPAAEPRPPSLSPASPPRLLGSRRPAAHRPPVHTATRIINPAGVQSDSRGVSLKREDDPLRSPHFIAPQVHPVSLTRHSGDLRLQSPPASGQSRVAAARGHRAPGGTGFAAHPGRRFTTRGARARAGAQKRPFPESFSITRSYQASGKVNVLHSWGS